MDKKKNGSLAATAQGSAPKFPITSNSTDMNVFQEENLVIAPIKYGRGGN